MQKYLGYIKYINKYICTLHVLYIHNSYIICKMTFTQLKPKLDTVMGVIRVNKCCLQSKKWLFFYFFILADDKLHILEIK